MESSESESVVTTPATSSNPDLPLRRPRYQAVMEARRPLSSPLATSPPLTSDSMGLLSPKAPFAVRNGYSVISSSSMTSLDSPFLGAGRPLSLGYDYSMSPNPHQWGSGLSPDFKEDDDHLHEPDPVDTRRKIERDGNYVSLRGLINLGTLLTVITAILVLFAGYPIITAVTMARQQTFGAFNLGGINASGQVPLMPWSFSLIDPDTPQEAYTHSSWANPSGKPLELVFSDEFNIEGRTFYPGDDPYWEAVDLHYWATNNLEWYDPMAINTQGGDLVITLQQKLTHDLNYQGGMLSTWNKFCFTGGYIETNVSLPGLANIAGLWPAVWTMGNLGRAGYGASLEGMWPYAYDACDIGTVPNQTINGQPEAATVNGDGGHGGILSFLQGQKLSRCTCKDSNTNKNTNPNGLLIHPGPKHSDGTFVGRSAPEIDVFEAQVTAGVGQVSQSAQFAPFNHGYIWDNTTENEVIVDPTISYQNPFIGSITQQAASVVTSTDPNCYEQGGTGCYSIYGFEYVPGFDNSYITWVSNNKISWTLNVAGLAADPLVQISDRPIPQEPMYIIANLGMSHNFGPIDLPDIPFPVHLHIDYIRVYQDPDNKNVGCNPKDFPTTDYINQYTAAYTNPNLTTWRDDYGQPFPGNSFLGQCGS